MARGARRQLGPLGRSGAIRVVGWAVLAAAIASGVPALAEPPTARQEPITPIVAPSGPLSTQAELGRRLFHEPRLSGDGSVSCASCHPLDKGGMDGRARSVGVGGRLGVINTPTVFNASLHFAQFWDARAEDVRAQVDGPLLDPLEMGHSWPGIVAVLEGDAGYRAAFSALHPGAKRIEPDHVRAALGAFVETLLTPDAPFDRWLAGDDGALTADQARGYARFKSLGCAACHQGVAIGGNMMHVFGILGDYFADRGTPVTKADLGRFNQTGVDSDRHRFKVPSLRNVALTAPYFHDGSAGTLGDAVRVMIKYQLGREASDEDVRLLVAFLHTLTGQWQGRPLGSGG